jgi:mRNA interferase MazF
MMKINQYEIWWIELDPTVGTETKKTRPCAIISNDTLNHYGRRVIVAPLLKQYKSWPYVVNVQPSEINGLDMERRVDLTQVRAVDKARVKRKMGVLESNYHKKITQAENAVLH